jgi:hypothetical protein
METTSSIHWLDGPEVDRGAQAEQHVVIEMGGPNLVIRATAHVDRAYTASLAEVLNAASATDTSVVIDPDPIRADDSFVQFRADDPLTTRSRADGQPVPVEAVAVGVVRIRAERSTWLVDVGHGRCCRTDVDVDVRFLGDDAWTPIVAVCVTPTSLVALGVDGCLLSADRALQPSPA